MYTEPAVASHGTSHARTRQQCKYTICMDIQKRELTQNHMQQQYSESAQEQRIALYESNQQQEERVTCNTKIKT